MGANLDYLDFGGALKGGFNIGLQIQQQRDARVLAQDARVRAQMMSDLRSQELETERLREQRLMQQAKNEHQEKELKRSQTANAVSQYSDLMAHDADPFAARAWVQKNNPYAVDLDFDQLTPPRPMTFQEGSDGMWVNGKLVENPNKIPSVIGVKVPEGYDAAMAGKQLVRRSEEKQTALDRNVGDMLSVHERLGLVKTPEEKDRLEVRLRQGGGKLRELETTALTKLADEASVLDLTDWLLEDVDAFESEFGKGSFSRFIGPLDARFDQAVASLIQDKTPMGVAAKRILGKFASLQNNTLKNRSGGTVTVQEGKRILGETGDKTDPNLVNKLRTFRDVQRNDLNITLDTYEGIELPPKTVDIIKGRSSRTRPTGDGQGGALTLPKNKAELQPGQVYQTSRGPAEWTGTGFRSVK